MLVASLAAICKALATIKEAVLASWLGTGDALDAYVVAATLPTAIASIGSSCLAAAMIPQWQKLSGSPREGHALYSSVLFLNIAFTTAVCGAVALFSRPAVSAMAAGFPAAKQAETTRCLLLLLPTIGLSGLSILWGAILSARRRFAAAQSAPVFTTMVVLLAAALTPRSPSAGRTLALATTAGAICEAAFVGWALSRSGFRLLPTFSGLHKRAIPTFKEFAFLSASNFAMTAVALLNQRYAAGLGRGSVAALSYASKLPLTLTAIATLAISTVLLPHFSALSAKRDWDAFRTTCVWSIAASAALLLPAVLALSAFSVNVTQLLYQHGAFSASDTELVSRVQLYYLWQIPFVIPGLIGTRMLISLEQNRQVLLIGFLNLATTALLTPVLAARYGVAGIGASTLAMYALATICVLALAAASLGRRARREAGPQRLANEPALF